MISTRPPGHSDPFLVVLAASWTAPGVSTLKPRRRPRPLRPRGDICCGVLGPGSVSRRAAGLMRSVRSMTLGEDEEALSRGTTLARVIFGRLVLVRGLCARPARAGLKTYRKSSSASMRAHLQKRYP